MFSSEDSDFISEWPANIPFYPAQDCYEEYVAQHAVNPQWGELLTNDKWLEAAGEYWTHSYDTAGNVIVYPDSTLEPVMR
jgi:hypothetical protein